MEEYLILDNRDTHLNVNPGTEAVFYVVNGVPYIRTSSGLTALKTTVTANGVATAPATFVQTYSTADLTLSAYTPDVESADYVGADAAALLIELNALRVAYENLRLFTQDLAAYTNSIVDNLQALGLAA